MKCVLLAMLLLGCAKSSIPCPAKPPGLTVEVNAKRCHESGTQPTNGELVLLACYVDDDGTLQMPAVAVLMLRDDWMKRVSK